MSKIDLISECCRQKAVVKNVYVKGELTDSYYVCTYCHFPCELAGYVARVEKKKIS